MYTYTTTCLSQHLSCTSVGSHLFPLLPNQKTVDKSSARVRVQGLFQLLQDDHVINDSIFSICNQLLPVFDPSKESGEHVVKLFGVTREQKQLLKFFQMNAKPSHNSNLFQSTANTQGDNWSKRACGNVYFVSFGKVLYCSPPFCSLSSRHLCLSDFKRTDNYWKLYPSHVTTWLQRLW